MKTIGITSTVPLEVLIAAGYKVIDLNNVFVTSDSYAELIDMAEKDGFPKSSCAWIKGIYGACLKSGIREVVGVVEGDCSNTLALLEVFKLKGITVYPFAYPRIHRYEDIKASILEFMKLFDVSLEVAEAVRRKLGDIRSLARRIDELTWIEGKATGFENHIYQVMTSDLNGDLDSFEAILGRKVQEMEQRPAASKKIRLGYIGVPPMPADLYEYVEKLDARFVYNESQREFAFPRAEKAEDIFTQYHDYTYPYNIAFRLEEIKSQAAERQLDAIIHYTQAFCHRALEDIIIKAELDIPVLNIEGDRLNCLDSRTKLRLEAFLDMLSDLKEVKA